MMSYNNKLDKFLQQLEKLVQQDGESASETLAELGTPFVSIGIMENSQISATLIGSDIYDTSTIFQACSISKPITALAVLKLVQQGHLNLDTSISTYLTPPQLSYISTPQTTHLIPQITLRHLLSHTSGLSRPGFPGYPYPTTKTHPLPTIPEILTGKPPTNTPSVTLTAFPGQRFAYSGGGMTVIQLILETVLGKPFPEIMQEVVLGPLNMTRSSYRFLDEGKEVNWAPVYYTGYEKAEPKCHLLPESAAAGLWTTPTDLLRAVGAVQMSLGGGGDGEGGGGFLERRWAEEMLEEVGGNGMGLGWFVRDGLPRFWHLGSNEPGYRCMLLGSKPPTSTPTPTSTSTSTPTPSSMPPNSAICIMTSSAQGITLIEKLYSAICYLKNWPSGIGTFGSFGGVPLITPLSDKSKSINPAIVKEWCGKWGDWRIIFTPAPALTPGDGNGNGNANDSNDEVSGGGSAKKGEEEENRGLGIQYKDFPVMGLAVAAIDSVDYGEGKGRSVDVVVEGLEVMFRLGWKGQERVVEWWQDGVVKVLERAK